MDGGYTERKAKNTRGRLLQIGYGCTVKKRGSFRWDGLLDCTKLRNEIYYMVQKNFAILRMKGFTRYLLLYRKIRKY